MKIYQDILRTIGNTPLVKLNKMVSEKDATVVVKLEFFNPGGSVKDRPGYNMIDDAERRGIIDKNTLIIEPTSGNTGIGLAMTCAVKGYKCILTMPESMSDERKKILTAYGAELVLTSADEGMKGAIAKAEELQQQHANSFIPMQFKNQANPAIHKCTTAEEIWHDTEGQADILVACAGTGGTITGTTEILKQKKSSFYTIAVEPASSPVLSGGKPGKHKIPGTGPGFVPDIIRKELFDEIIAVSDDDAIETAKKTSQLEGIFCGLSGGAAIQVAREVAKRPENKDKLVVVIIPDTGERYLSAF
ncbi:MAG: cysteine synthase A [Bacteroidetes bacterium]|jgi:cysteine synthase A|nr:cysteine synthase A [Bacteroidota bacterium]